MDDFTATALPALEPPFSAQALQILRARYLLKGPGGEPRETPAQLLWRVASALAAVEQRWGADPAARAREAYELLARLEFLPNSPTLMNAGKARGQLSACFVLPVEDTLDAIFETIKDAARIHSTGGGTGFAFSRLRPRDDEVAGGGRASGPVAFLRVFDAATAAVHQGGVRRGANMGILRVDHPDILEFVDAKRDPRELTHFNVSVAATDAFMEAVERGAAYDLINPRTGAAVASLDARAVWDRIVQAAWKTGDPGLVFVDRINAVNPTPDLGGMESTNPCGELPLIAYESCNLGSLNVGKHVNEAGDDLDWERLRANVHHAVRLLDDVIEANAFPLPAIAEVTRRNRKIGLGVMGFADLLIELGVPYASEQALALAERLMGFVAAEAIAASQALARERGPFPGWPGSRWAARDEPPRRNATVTTVAPTGTIALLAGCSSGIEPLYAVAYVRRALDGTALLPFFHPALERIGRERGFWSERLAAHVARTGSLAGLDEVPADVRALFQTAHEIPPEWHVRMQAAFQRHVENAVSKTCNLPRQATPEDVARIYRLAYELGCKGITVYRDGSRQGQILAARSDDDDAAVADPPLQVECGECVGLSE